MMIRGRWASLVCTLVLSAATTGCKKDAPSARSRPAGQAALPAKRARDYKVVHVFVALCDNRNQGIARVRAELGNGQDPKSNLYWGARYGVKTYFKRAGHWRAATAATRAATPAVLDRVVFRAQPPGPAVYVVADAYDGARMKATLKDFFNAAAGATAAELTARFGLERVRIQAGGHADMVCFVGHNGLMDVQPPGVPEHTGRPNPRCAVVLACKSKPYFTEPLGKAKCIPLITTTGMMAPEAYTLEAIIRSWAAGETPELTRERAAQAYAKYQRCSLDAARRLFAAGGKDPRLDEELKPTRASPQARGEHAGTFEWA